MKSKITLITPPDIFENANKSILLCHMSDSEQDTVSRWLKDADLSYDLNLYAYTNEANPVWFLYALNRCEYKYINIDNVNTMTQALAGYVLSRNNVFYRTDNTNIAAIYSHINTNRVNDINEFLERVLGAKTSESKPQL
jgi:hypothetical protein